MNERRWRDRGTKAGPFVRMIDDEGRRHYIKATTVTALSDTDPLQNETYVRAGNQGLRIPEPLDEVLENVLGLTPRDNE